MKIVIFGIGELYRQNKKNISTEDTVVAFLDNNEKMQGKTKEGICIYSPLHIHRIQYDTIVIMSNYAMEMKEQLLELGCQRDKILHFAEYLNRQKKRKMEVYFADKEKKGCKCLIITSSLGYHGGAIAAVYAALALQNNGYNITIAAPDGDMKFIREFQKKGIEFLVYPNLEYAKWDELFWVKEYEKIIVNTYPMILCALEIGKYRKVLVWLHESDIIYQYMEFWKDKVLEYICSSEICIYAVSDVARKNFIRNVTEYTIGILPYGIPDLNGTSEVCKGSKTTFALVGTIYPVKQQLVYLEAIKLLDEIYQKENEFLIIGNAGKYNEYVNEVRKGIGTFQNQCVKWIGKLDREEMEKKYRDIDVLVIASAQETMSLVATEAMMYGKTCIICDVAGMAEYVRHGENGLICRTGDADSLAEQLTYCIENRDMLDIFGKEARKTYCKNFTMKAFGDRLEKGIGTNIL